MMQLDDRWQGSVTLLPPGTGRSEGLWAGCWGPTPWSPVSPGPGCLIHLRHGGAGFNNFTSRNCSNSNWNLETFVFPGISNLQCAAHLQLACQGSLPDTWSPPGSLPGLPAGSSGRGRTPASRRNSPGQNTWKKITAACRMLCNRTIQHEMVKKQD